MASQSEIIMALATLKALANSDRILNDKPAIRGYFYPLEPYPASVLLKAVKRAARESQWFPPPSILRGFCEESMDALADQAVLEAEKIAIDGRGLDEFEGRALFYEKIRRWEEAAGVDREEWTRETTNRGKARLLPSWVLIEQTQPESDTLRLEDFTGAAPSPHKLKALD